jgi:hypothetical protein
MDLLTSATAFATIINLVGQFRSEIGNKNTADFNEFLTWLIKTNHHDIKTLIENNSKTTIGIKAMLNEQHETVLSQLQSINEALITFSSQFPALNEVANGINPNLALSDQSMSILRQFEETGCSEVLESDGTLHILDGPLGRMSVEVPRFLKDDLKKLVDLQLLRVRNSTQGKQIYMITRAASQFVLSTRSQNVNYD